MATEVTSAQAEVIISTYNSPRFLDLVLCALSRQSLDGFSICVADDGSGPATSEVIAHWQRRHFGGRLRHVWQPDEGFQKNRILNRAIASSSHAYLVFIDGDCLASPDFLKRHLELARKGYFISGGLVRMPLETNDLLSHEMIESGLVFQADWLTRHAGVSSFSSRLKAGLWPRGISALLEHISPVKRTWNGCNASGWRSDLLAVNGFNESMRYGAEDVELGVRLNNAGIRCRHCRYTAPLLHMEHGRSYAHAEEIAANKRWVKQLKGTKQTWTPHGIFPTPADQP